MKNSRWLILAVLLFISAVFTACEKEIAIPEDAYYMHNEKPKKVVLQMEKPNAAELYEKTVCTAEMLCGEYSLAGGNEEIGKYCNEMEYIDLPSETYGKITAIPYAISGMPDKNYYLLDENGVSTPVYMMALSFRSDTGMPVMKEASCKVDGDKVSFCLANAASDGEQNAYSFSDTVLTYTFEIRGMNLKLSAGDKSVMLAANCFSSMPKKLSGDVYLSGGEGIGSVYRINYMWQENGESGFTCYDKDGNQFSGAYGLLYEDGGFVLGLLSDKEWISRSFAYYYTVDGGLIFTDGEKTYSYTDDLSKAYLNRLRGNLDEKETGTITEEIIKKRDDLVSDLIKAFNENGIDATIDAQTGELSIGAGFLFQGDSSDITAQGKSVLSKVMKVYTDMVSKKEYRDFVFKILVEGHTAPLGNSSLEGGYQLSQERADKATAYILSEESGLSKESRELLSELLEPVGVSCSRPVLDKSGNVDMSASRRVSFRVTIRVDSK